MKRLAALSAACLLLIAAATQAENQPDPAAGAPLSPFGIGSCHTNNWSAQANARWIPQMAAIGITNHRTCNTSWGARYLGALSGDTILISGKQGQRKISIVSLDYHILS